MTNYKLSAKRNGKWWTYGNIKPNSYGNLSLGMKKTPELVEWFNSKNDGEWLNLSLFEDKPKDQSEPKPNGYQPGGDDTNPPF